MDEFTVDLVCPDACPILDIITPHYNFAAPAYSQADPDAASNWPMGTGPFKIEEISPGEFIRYTAYEGYWGDTGYFDEVVILWREEAAVRAAMVSTGEAQFGERLTLEAAEAVPQAFLPLALDTDVLRFRGRDETGNPDPVWGDPRFRQALAYAIDCPAMAEVFTAGTVECANRPFNAGTLGAVDPEQRTDYEYDPVKARELLDEVLGEGEGFDISMYGRAGDFEAVFAETIMSYWEDVGLTTTFEFVEGERRNELADPGVDGMPPDVLINLSHTNDLLDASVTLAYLDGCNYSSSYAACDPEFADKFAEARSLSGEERRAAMEQLMLDYYYPLALVYALWPTPVVFGGTANLEWDYPTQEMLRPDEMRLTD